MSAASLQPEPDSLAGGTHVMPEAGHVRRRNGRPEIKQIDQVLQPEPLGSAGDPNRDEFELKIAWLVRLSARGQVAHQLANSVDHLAKCVILLSIALSLNLVFANWSASTIPHPKALPFHFDGKE